MSGDPLIDSAHAAEADAPDSATQQRFADLFDVRRIIGALFAVYGVILVIAGLFASDADVDRAQGINSNLWVGLALLVVAAIFFVWAFRAPVGAELVEGEDGDRAPAEAPAPRGVDAAALPGAVSATERERRGGRPRGR